MRRTSTLWCEKLKCKKRNWRITFTLLYSLLQHFFTLQYSNYFPALLYHVLLHHFSTMLFSKLLYKNCVLTLLWNAFLQHSSVTLLCNTLLKHFSTFVCNTSPQHCSFNTLLRNTSLQHPSQRFLYNILSNIPEMYFPSTVRTQQQQSTTPKKLPNTTEGLKSLENHLCLIIDYLQLYHNL